MKITSYGVRGNDVLVETRRELDYNELKQLTEDVNLLPHRVQLSEDLGIIGLSLGMPPCLHILIEDD